MIRTKLRVRIRRSDSGEWHWSAILPEIDTRGYNAFFNNKKCFFFKEFFKMFK